MFFCGGRDVLCVRGNGLITYDLLCSANLSRGTVAPMHVKGRCVQGRTWGAICFAR